MPYCVLLIVLFWKVLLLLPVPRLVMLMVVPPDPTPINVCVLPLPTRFTFLITLFVAATAPGLVWSQTTALDVLVLLFVMVRSRDEVLLFDSLMVPWRVPWRMATALAAAPDDAVIVTVLPAAGLIVTVL